MQTYHGDASDRAVSLDKDFFYMYMSPHPRYFVALLSHNATVARAADNTNEIETMVSTNN